MLAQVTHLKAGEFIHTFGDAHIYLNHLDGLREQLGRRPGALPQVKIAKKQLFDLEFDDFTLEHYVPHPPIKFPIAV